MCATSKYQSRTPKNAHFLFIHGITNWGGITCEFLTFCFLDHPNGYPASIFSHSYNLTLLHLLWLLIYWALHVGQMKDSLDLIPSQALFIHLSVHAAQYTLRDIITHFFSLMNGFWINKYLHIFCCFFLLFQLFWYQTISLTIFHNRVCVLLDRHVCLFTPSETGLIWLKKWNKK